LFFLSFQTFPEPHKPHYLIRGRMFSVSGNVQKLLR
jgi:hypothetical protein